MDRDRLVVSDVVWSRIERRLPGKTTDRGVTASDTGMFLEAVLRRVRTGTPWRDLPLLFGDWHSVFRRGAKDGVFERLFEVLSAAPDFEYALMDGAIVSVHQKGERRERGTEDQSIGRSRGGLTTKIVALVDALGNLVRFVLLPGQRHDMVGVELCSGMFVSMPCWPTKPLMPTG